MSAGVKRGEAMRDVGERTTGTMEGGGREAAAGTEITVEIDEMRVMGRPAGGRTNAEAGTESIDE